MKKSKKLLIYSFLFSMFFVFPVFVFAQMTIPSPSNTPIGVHIENPLKDGNNDLMSFITLVLKNVVIPVAVVAVVMWIIWAGFSFLTAQGKPEEIKKAQSRLLWSLIGAGILLGATGISAVVQRTVEALMK